MLTQALQNHGPDWPLGNNRRDGNHGNKYPQFEYGNEYRYNVCLGRSETLEFVTGQIRQPTALHGEEMDAFSHF